MFGGLLYKHMNSALLTSLCARAVEPHLHDLSRAATCCVLAFAELLKEIHLAQSTALESQLSMHDWAVLDPFYSQERDRNLQRHIDLCLLVCIAHKRSLGWITRTWSSDHWIPLCDSWTCWNHSHQMDALCWSCAPRDCYFASYWGKRVWARWIKVALMCGDLSMPSPVWLVFFRF